MQTEPISKITNEKKDKALVFEKVQGQVKFETSRTQMGCLHHDAITRQLSSMVYSSFFSQRWGCIS